MTSPAPSGSDAMSQESFERLGRLTRNLHEAMTTLGLDQSLHAISQEFPDARDRLSHVGHMTERAATKVLNLIDAGQPECQAFGQDSEAFTQEVAALQAQGDCSSPATQALLARCHTMGQRATQFAENQNMLLSEIMMTQDFQDLSGQIIQKVIRIISDTEKQLLDLLMHSASERSQVAIAPKEELAGPQVPDKALKQDDVDDLLASLGF